MPQRSDLLLWGLVALLPLLVAAAMLWRRIYRDDPANTARRILKNSAVPLLLRMVVRTLDLAFFVILQRTLPGAEIGPYNLATLYVGQYLATLAEFGLGVLLTREVARDPGVARRMFGVTLAMRLSLAIGAAAPAAALLIGAFGWLGSSGLGESITPIGQQAIWVLLLTLLPSAYSGAVTALYNANERMEVPAIVEVVTAVLGLVARLAALWWGFGIVGLAWASVLVSTLTALIFVYLQLRDFFAPSLVWDSGQMRVFGVLAFPLMLNNLLNAVFFRFDTLIIKAFGGGQGDLLFNQYDQAYKVLGIAMIVPPVVTFAVFPMLARRAAGDRAVMAQAQNTTLRALLFVALPMAAGLAALSDEVIRLVNGRNAAQYLPISAHVLAILAWFLPFSFVNGLLQYVLIALNRQRAITRAFAIGAAFNLAANLVLIPIYGLYAAAGVTIASELVLLAVFMPLLSKEGMLPPLVHLGWRPVLAALAMLVVIVLLRPYGWLLAALVGGLVYLVVLVMLGGITSEDRELLRRIVAR